MPSYEYRCNNCGQAMTLYYRSYKDYDAAVHTCVHCGSTDLTRLISRVAISKPTRGYAGMSSGEMLSVLEGGDSREIGQLFEQVGAGVPDDKEYQEVTDRLLKGEQPGSIEADLQGRSEQQVTKDKKIASGEN